MVSINNAGTRPSRLVARAPPLPDFSLSTSNVSISTSLFSKTGAELMKA